MRQKQYFIIQDFQKPFQARAIQLTPCSFTIPAEAKTILKHLWNEQLKKKQRALQRVGIQTEIRLFHKDASPHPYNALYEGEEVKMWPGGAISLAKIERIKDALKIHVFPIDWSFILTRNNPQIKKIFQKYRLRMPNLPLAFCTFPLTDDGFLVLTVRGPKTPMYPGKWYGVGGNPQSVTTNVWVHQKEELEEEVKVVAEEIENKSMYFAGLVQDRYKLAGKPDLFGWVKVKVSKKDITKRLYAIPQENRPNDVSDVMFVPATPEGLFEILTKRSKRKKLVPVGRGGLFLYGKYHFGKEWAAGVAKALRK